MTTLYFEDLEVGQHWTTVGRTVTEADIVAFAGLSGDFNPIHLDAESTKGGIYGQRVAQGVLGLSMATGLLDSLGLFKKSMGAMLSIDEWKFLKPTFIGDTIHLELSIESLRLSSEGNAGIVRRRLTLLNQTGEVVQDGFITVLVLTRPMAS